MTSIDPRLAAALATQLLQWRERIGDELAIGHLTTATHLEPGAAYHGGGGDLRADAEVAFELGRDVDLIDPAAAAIAGVGVAL